MSCYEEYFKYKQDKTYSVLEYVIYNMYTGIFRAPFNSTKKNNFFSSYSNHLKKYCNLKERPKLSEVSFYLLIFKILFEQVIINNMEVPRGICVTSFKALQFY